MKKLALICLSSLLVISCTPSEEVTTRTIVSPEATISSPVSDPNTEMQESIGKRQDTQRKKITILGPAEPVEQEPLAEQQAANRKQRFQITPEEASAELERMRKVLMAAQKAVEQGDAGAAAAQFLLGLGYATGQGVPQDHNEAVKWFRKAAEQGDAAAQFLLGWMYFEGEGVPQDDKEATKWVTKAAEQGFAKAQFHLGLRYATGQGVPQDEKEAVKWFIKAAEQGFTEAQCHLGLMYHKGRGVPQDNKEAVKWYTKAAQKGYALAQYHLGSMYDFGKGIQQDDKEAVKWYTKAAEQGNLDAQCELGVTYLFRLDDPQEAIKWLAKAAEHGHAGAQFVLGLMYSDGEGVPHDDEEAVKWYAKAAEQGHAAAQLNLGEMYRKGEGVPQDYKEAVKWYKKAAERGDAQAQFNLALMYHEGEGVPQDDEEVVKWYAKAAEQGHAGAQHNLGLMYYKGDGVRQDYKEAVKWYKKAAEQGEALAQCKLGLMYYQGRGVLEDYVKAYKWFVLSAMNGNEHAQVEKQHLRKKLTPSQIEEAQQRARVFLAVEKESSEEDRKSVEIVTKQPIVSQGTGFLFAKSGLVATNYHVVSQSQDIRVYFPQAGLEFDTTVELKDISNDLVVLRIKDFVYDDIFSQEIPFSVRRSSTVRLGEEVFTLGFPLGKLLGKSAKFSDGTISSLSGLAGSANLFQINNPIQPGNSGGPLFDREGNLIGIVLATLDAKFFYEILDTIPQNVNFAIKSDYLINLISMLPEGASILSRKGLLKDRAQEEQIESLMPYIITVYVR